MCIRDRAISRARNKVIKKGELTFLQIGARYEGYASSIGRPVILGKATETQKELIKIGYLGQETVMKALKADVPARDVARLYEKTIQDAGYGEWLLYGPCPVSYTHLDRRYSQYLQNDPIEQLEYDF